MTDDAFEKSEILRKQYESVASIPREENKVKEDFFVDENVLDLQNDDGNQPQITPCVDFCSSMPFVGDCIDMLTNQAAPGPDGIPTEMIKGAKSAFASMLSNILRYTLDSGEIPKVLKLALCHACPHGRQQVPS